MMCPRCLVTAFEEVRGLPGVDEVTVRLVAYGESRVTIVPAEAVSRDELLISLGRVGFDVVGVRHDRSPAKAGPRRHSRRS